MSQDSCRMLTNLTDLHYSWLLQAGSSMRFGDELGHLNRVSVGTTQGHLDGTTASTPHISGLVNNPHTTAPQFSLNHTILRRTNVRRDTLLRPANSFVFGRLGSTELDRDH